MKLSNRSILSGSLSAAIGVAAGAFGAHGLKNILTPERLAVFETAVRYQMYHAFAMLVVGLVAAMVQDERRKDFNLPFRLFVAGTVFFSGSLYLLCLSGLTWIGVITPIGGLCFILGWLTLAHKSWKLL